MAKRQKKQGNEVKTNKSAINKNNTQGGTGAEDIHIAKEDTTALKVKDTTDITKKEYGALQTRAEGSVAVIPEEEKALANKEDTTLATRPKTDVMVQSIAQEDRNAYAEDSAGEETLKEKDSHDDTIGAGTIKKNETMFEYIFTMAKAFFALLFSFIIAIIPDIREIFSWSVFIKLCKMVRIEHTLFALPFAYVGLVIASGNQVSFSALLLLTLAMFGIRSFAMTMNRIIDLQYDKQNPRTQQRLLVTGEVTVGQAKAFAYCSLAIFIIAAGLISSTLLMLTPIPIALAIIYSYLKRFTCYCHFVLGSILALAPIAGELTVVGTLSSGVVLLAFGILFWVAGFDILYSLQDAEFDTEHGLYSIPACFGVSTALLIAKFCHINTVIFFLLFGIFSGLGWFWYVVWLGIAGGLLWEHHIIKPNDFSKMNQAFFVINACISIAVLIGVYFG